MSKLHASEELAMQARAESANAQMQAHVDKAKDSVDGIVAQFTTALFASLATITDMVRNYLTRFTTIFVAPTAIVLFMTGHTILGSISVGLGTVLLLKVDTPLSNKFSAIAIPLSLLDLDHITIPAVNICDSFPPITTIVGWLIPMTAFLMYFRLVRAQETLEIDVEDQDIAPEAEHKDTPMEIAQPTPENEMEDQDVTPPEGRVDHGAERGVIPMNAELAAH